MARTRFSGCEEAEVWVRWRRGESLSEIARVLGRSPGGVHHVLARRGGIAPAVRRRGRLALTSVEREEISRGLAAGWSARRVADGLGRSSSTVSREIARNGGRDGYRAARADRRAWDRACRPKRCLLSVDVRLRDAVAEKLLERWSPEQISGWLAVEYPQDETMRVSAETIYKTLFVQSRGALKKELVGQLRRRKSIRRSKQATSAGNLRCPIPDLVSISQRPAEADDRAVPGHWEGDLLEGSRGTPDRHPGRAPLSLCDAHQDSTGKDTNTVVTALSRARPTTPHRAAPTPGLGPRQRARRPPPLHRRNRRPGLLLRPPKPLATRIKRKHQRPTPPILPQRHQPRPTRPSPLDNVANQLNTRPRKTLGYHTPAYTLNKALSDATTG